MATISVFFGIIIRMYYNEHNPPHFHASYQGFEAVFDMEEGRRIGGNLPIRAEKIIAEWAREHKEELLENWSLMRKEKPFKKIRGADQWK